MPSRSVITSNLLGLIGAGVGGYLGYLGFGWFYRHGFYAMIMPGALVGLGCGIAARHPSAIRGVLCGLGAIALGVVTEWLYFPFIADGSFRYFLGHLADVQTVGLLMIGVGAVIAYWMGKDGGFGGIVPGAMRKPPQSKMD